MYQQFSFRISDACALVLRRGDTASRGAIVRPPGQSILKTLWSGLRRPQKVIEFFWVTGARDVEIALEKCLREKGRTGVIHFVLQSADIWKVWIEAVEAARLDVERYRLPLPMHFCLATGPLDPMLSTRTAQCELRLFDEYPWGEVLVVAYHHGYLDPWDTDGIYRKLFDFRVHDLFCYIYDNLLEGLSIPAAVECAFDRMDRAMADKAKGKVPQGFWLSKINTVVVVVHDREIYTLGANYTVRVLLQRSGGPVFLSTALVAGVCVENYFYAIMGGDEGEDLQKYEPLYKEFYCRRERLQDGDAYLVIASDIIWDYICGPARAFIPVLQSRIDAAGLEGACRSVVGRFKDAPKTIAVVTLLDGGAHLPAVEAGRPVVQYEAVVPVVYANLDDLEDVDIDPLRYLLPWVDGKEQDPEPQTSFHYMSCETLQKPEEPEVFVGIIPAASVSAVEEPKVSAGIPAASVSAVP